MSISYSILVPTGQVEEALIESCFVVLGSEKLATQVYMVTQKLAQPPQPQTLHASAGTLTHTLTITAGFLEALLLHHLCWRTWNTVSTSKQVGSKQCYYRSYKGL